MAFQVSGRITIAGKARGQIAVSNGETLTRTDPEGAYRLRVDPHRHRFVCVVTPDDARPADTFYIPVRDLENRRKTADFDLQPAPERRRRTFECAQITDLHIQVENGRAPAPQHLKADLGRALAAPAFAIATGDLTNRGDIPSLKAYLDIATSAPCPVFHVYAGHDGIIERETPGTTDDHPWTRNYEAILGPAYYSFNWGGRHFVLYPNEDRYFAGPERQAKSRWLRADLRAHRGRETLLFLHQPPPVEFLDALVKTSVTAVFFGHFHSSKTYAYRGIQVFGTPAFSFGGIDTSPRSVRRLSFHRGRMQTTLVPVSPASRPKTAPVRRPGRKKTGPLSLRWSRRLNGHIHRAAPVIVEDRALVSIQDETGANRQGAVCLSLKTGRTLWRLGTDASVKNSAAVENTLGAVVSVTGQLTAFDTRDGNILWQHNLPGYPDRWVYGAPAISEGVVYAGGKGGYSALEARTGTPIWTAQPAGTDSDAWPCYAGPILVGDRVILLVQRVGLVALHRSDGRETWRCPLAVEYMYPRPVLAGGRIITGGEPGELAALNPETGRVEWRRNITEERAISGLGTDGTRIYAGIPSGHIRAYSATGRPRWKFETGQERLDMTPYQRAARSITGGPITDGNRIIAGAGDGHLYLLDPKTGAQVDRWEFGAPLSAPPALHDSGLLAGAYDGLLGYFDIPT